MTVSEHILSVMTVSEHTLSVMTVSEHTLSVMTVSEHILSLNGFILSIDLLIHYLFITHDLFMPGNEIVVDRVGCYTIKK